MIQNPMMFTRSIKGAPASILFVFMLTRQAMTVKLLCSYTDYKPDSIREALNVLTGYGLVRENKRAHGESIFSLADGYEVLLPGINPRALGMIEQAAGTGATEEDSQQAEKDSFVVDSSTVDDEETNIQNPKKSDSGAKKQGSSSYDDDELINQEKNHHHQSEPGFEKIAVRKILENLHLVFGGTLDSDEIPPGITGARILGWVCKINADIRHGCKIYNPIGLLRTRLASGKNRRILHLDLLPGSFLGAIGLEAVESYGAYSEQAVQIAFQESRAELEAEDIREERLAELAAAVLPADRETWEALQAELRETLAKASWENWVKDAQVLCLSGQVMIAARNQYAAKWLTEHIAKLPYPITSLEDVLCNTR